MQLAVTHGDAEPHMQLVRHAVPPALQTYGEHIGVVVVMHEPAVQMRSVSWPAAHESAQPLPCTPVCGWQLPASPATLHDEHVPHGPACAQHTVSTQWPVAH